MEGSRRRSRGGLAAAGGDGTVEEVARAIAGRQLPIAVLPLGTANNISRALGQANVPFEDLVAGWADAWRQPFDIGLARGPWGTFRFLEGVGAGLLADGMAEIKEGRADYIRQANDADGRMAAALGLFHRLLGRMAAMRFNLSLDGRDHSGEYLLLEVLNFGAAGPNLRLAPHAEPSDGLLDVVLVDEHHRRDLADRLSLSRIDPVRTPALPVYQGRHITLSCGSCNLHLDDTVWTGQRAGEDPIVIDLVVEPQALTFLVPRASVRPNAR
jgi:diacylglycerol kinase (ATP)